MQDFLSLFILLPPLIFRACLGESTSALGPFTYAPPREIHWRLAQKKFWMAPVVIPKHKLIFCTIPKVGSSGWLKLLRRMEGFPDWRFNPYVVNHGIDGLRKLYDYSREEAAAMLNNESWTKVAVVRDPAHRLLSAFLDKIAGSNDSPYQLNLYSQRLYKLPVSRFQNESFSDFVDRVELAAYENSLDQHWQLQSKHCDLEAWLPKYDRVLLHSEDGSNNALLPDVLDVVAQKSPFPNLLGEMTDTFSAPHPTLVSELRNHQMRTDAKFNAAFQDRRLLEKVVLIYAQDYRLFGIKVPTVAHSA